MRKHATPVPAVAAALVLVVAAAAYGPAAVAAPEPARIAVVPVDTGTSETLLAVAFPDAQHGFAVGQNGAILATTDGGVTWSRQRSGLEISADEVAGRIAGQRAERQPVVLFGVSFVNARRGWAVGEGTVLTTGDGGTTWTALSLPDIATIPGEGPGRLGAPLRAVEWSLRAVRFQDERHGVVVGATGTVLVTDDGGQSWTWRGDRRFGDLVDVSFADGANGAAVGMSGGAVGQLSATIATADAGATWQIQEVAGVGQEVRRASFSAVAKPAPQRTYLVGDGGRIFVTVDGGKRWAVQRHDTTEQFNGVAFATPNRGVAVGLTRFTGASRASLVATDDGGETWVGRLHTGEILWDVGFATPEAAYAVGCAEAASASSGPVVQADGLVADGLVAEALPPCSKSLLLRISFAGEPTGAGDGGNGGVPWPIVGGAAAVLVVAGLFAASRRRGAHR